MAKFGDVIVEDNHICVHPDRDCSGIRPSDSGADDHNPRGSHASDATHEDTSTSGRSLQVFCCHEGRHSASHFTHWREQWKRSISKLDSLIRDRGGLGIDERVGQGL
jgi:hypothetical protein